jgi:hypothetical protein
MAPSIDWNFVLSQVWKLGSDFFTEYEGNLKAEPDFSSEKRGI